MLQRRVSRVVKSLRNAITERNYEKYHYLVWPVSPHAVYYGRQDQADSHVVDAIGIHDIAHVSQGLEVKGVICERKIM